MPTLLDAPSTIPATDAERLREYNAAVMRILDDLAKDGKSHAGPRGKSILEGEKLTRPKADLRRL